MQIDIGFGDVVYPGPVKSDFPTILDLPAPELLCYSRESTIAEKFEAMVKLGSLNSRMKDFYDIWLLSRQFNFDGKTLAEAVRLTFDRRGSALSTRIEAVNDDFILEKQPQWIAFRKRLQQEHVPAFFGDIVSAVAKFIAPVVFAAFEGSACPKSWIAPGPWT